MAGSNVALPCMLHTDYEETVVTGELSLNEMVYPLNLGVFRFSLHVLPIPKYNAPSMRQCIVERANIQHTIGLATK